MAATLSHSEYEAKFYNLYPEKNIKLLTQYESWNTKITHECLVCGYIWDQPPRTAMKGTLRCKKCKAEDQKLTNEEFVKRYYEKFPNSSFIFKSEYKSMHELITIECIDCGEVCEKTPAKLYHREVSCTKCYNKNRITNHEEFLNKLHTVYPDKKYNKIGQYTGMHNYIEVECDKGHVWFAPASRLLRTPSWCPHDDCKRFKPTLTQEEFAEKVAKVHEGFKILSEYKTTKDKVKMQCENGHIWESSASNMMYNKTGCPYCYVSQSKAEKEISKIFEGVFLERDTSFGVEIDLLSNNHKFGIEFNGLIFHSFGLTYPNNLDKFDKKKHLKKTEIVESNSYQLFHIREDHWLDPKKKDIWISMISNKLGKSTKIFARKLKIVDLTNNKDFVNNFLEDNHLQGKCPYTYAYGLWNPKTGTVYSIMTFGPPRYDKNIQWELLRFCSYKNHSISGGASKILKYFEKTKQPIDLLSYASRDWSNGRVYKNLGFDFIENTNPNYWYYDKKLNRHSRQSCQKDKLEKKLDIFDINKTELENMLANEYRIYYNTGNMKFVKKYEKKEK